MVIAVNTRLLINNIHGGIEWFTYEVLNRVVSSNPGHRFIFIFDRPWDQKFIFADNVEPVFIGPRAVHPFLWYWWIEKSVPKVLRKTGADIFISPDGMIPSAVDIPCIPVIHDISFMHRPDDIPFLKSLFYRNWFPRYASRAARIMTVSQFSASDISSTFGIDRSLIDVVYNGASEEFYPDPGPLTPIIPGFEEERSFFLFVGNLSPRKNLPNTIRAYERFRNETANDIMLVITGGRFFLNGELDRLYRRSQYRDDIIFTGSLGREELRRLYSNALGLLFVSWIEGFGIPVVEAMRCGTPVITSDSSSLPEIAGDAAILTNPGNITEIADAMKKVATEKETRETMVSRGYDNVARFTWDNTAVTFWNSVGKVINIH